MEENITVQQHGIRFTQLFMNMISLWKKRYPSHKTVYDQETWSVQT